MEKPQLINFIAKVMEDSGFKVYKNFKTSQRIIDIYAILNTTIGDFGVVVACNNNDESIEVGVDELREMEKVGESINASKVAIVTSSSFNNQATNYASRKNIKLVDRENLLELAKKYQEKNEDEYVEDDVVQDDDIIGYGEYYDYSGELDDMDYLMRKKDEENLIYNSSNSLYGGQSSSHRGSLFKRESHSGSGVNLSPSNYYPSSLNNVNFLEILSKILSNPIAIVVLVVLISYALSYLFGSVLKSSEGISGLVEMFAALILSYVLTFTFIERSRFFIIKGTAIFFVSLILLIILIFI